MAKNLKLKIKNSQIAAAVSLGGLKEKLAKKQAPVKETEEEAIKAPAAAAPTRAKVKKDVKEAPKVAKEPPPKVKARSRSVFAEPTSQEEGSAPEEESSVVEPIEEFVTHDTLKHLFHDEPTEVVAAEEPSPVEESKETTVTVKETVTAPPPTPVPPAPAAQPSPTLSRIEKILREPMISYSTKRSEEAAEQARETHRLSGREKLGPTGRHVRDLLPPPRPVQQPRPAATPPPPRAKPPIPLTPEDAERAKAKARAKGRPGETAPATEEKAGDAKASRFKEYKDIKPVRKQEGMRSFDARDRQGLRESEDEQGWRRRRGQKQRIIQEPVTIRPTSLNVRVPISIKDLASEMKLKASQLIERLFAQGLVFTINDLLDDETTIQLLGHEFGCAIKLDTKEEERIRITDKSIKEEVAQSNQENLVTRPPVVAFMGHVDHGKTSLIDAIRKSNRVAGEAGAITQHIGAFRCPTPVGDITVLDTPGHEAFSAMRARGADVTDIVVLVIAGDEGIRTQTTEAIQHAKAAGVTIVVAINKCDKPNFNVETVYRQLSEQELLPEAWGGTTITVNCSAVTGEGIQTLLEMLALQSEVLELQADPTSRARGTVLESEMHKGLGAVATVLVQNGTLRPGDALVFGQHWGRVKTMRDDLGNDMLEAGPSTPVEITGLSGLPSAGQDFIVVRNDTEAREIAEARMMDFRTTRLQQTKRKTMENLFQEAEGGEKKILNVVLRADVQGSLEALRVALEKIESDKVILNIIFHGVGEVSESDVTLALASKAVVIGFHTSIESHADALIKQLGVQVRLHDIIYHAIDDVKAIMTGLLDRIAEEHDQGKAEIKATFKSSHLGIIAGCQVIEGTIIRSNHVRLIRNGEVLWKGPIASLKRVKEDVKEVSSGMECGILLQGFKDVQQGDILQAFEITYKAQTL